MSQPVLPVELRRALLSIEGFAISGGGDCDTIAAMAGGIVALSTGREGIPARWLRERERLPFDR